MLVNIFKWAAFSVFGGYLFMQTILFAMADDSCFRQDEMAPSYLCDTVFPRLPDKRSGPNPEVFGMQLGITTLEQAEKLWQLENRSFSYLENVLPCKESYGINGYKSRADRIKENPKLNAPWYSFYSFLTYENMDWDSSLYHIGGSMKFERIANQDFEMVKERKGATNVAHVLGVEGAQYLLLGFDDRGVLNRVTLIFSDYHYDKFIAILKEKYQSVYSCSPFLGNKKHVFYQGECLIVAGNPHMDHSGFITYITVKEYQREREVLAKRSREKKKREVAAL